MPPRRDLANTAAASAAPTTARMGRPIQRRGKRMGHTKSCEVGLAVRTTEELLKGLDDLRQAWKRDPSTLPKGLSCSESKEGQFVLVAAESAFVTIPGACVIKGIGAIELVGSAPAFEEGANSKALILKATAEGWKFSVKFVPPIVRERNAK
jgi:hypothetical protein